MIRSFTHALIVTAVVAAVFPCNAAAQANTARLLGTVLDPSGAVLPGASVTLRSLRTNAKTDVVTDLEGRFAFQELPIGRYELSVSLQGFKTGMLDSIELLTGQVQDLKVQLEVGDLQSIVDVPGGLPLIQTASSTVQTSMTERQVQELPLNGRNPLQLVALTAGATITDA